MKNLLLLLTVTTILSCSKKDEVSIINNVDTSLVQIGSQIWAKRNLDVSTYRNGDTIPQVTDPTEWKNLTTGAWCYYNNDPAMEEIYGKLYNWYAVGDPRGLAPEGWKIPSDSDWNVLSNYLGGNSIAGVKLKESGTEHWILNKFGTNSTGFTGLPAGLRQDGGYFYLVGKASWWWTSDFEPQYNCFPGGGISYKINGEGVSSTYDYLSNGFVDIIYGLSVRCLKN